MKHQYYIEMSLNAYLSKDDHGKWNTTGIISQAERFSSSEITALSEHFEQKFGISIDEAKVIPILSQPTIGENNTCAIR